MKAPQRIRRKPKFLGPAPDGIDIEASAREAVYVGSPEHKDSKSFAGPPHPRRDAAICDRSLSDSSHQITEWVRAAIRGRMFSGDWQGRFPKYIWHRVGDIVYEGRQVTPGRGDYKGYPLFPDQIPDGVS